MNLEKLLKEYKKYKKLGLNIDMTRGKPSFEQLNLSSSLFDVLNSESDFFDSNKNDVRNYGTLEGIPECRTLMSELLGVGPENVLIYGNSSLNAMYDQISRSYLFGVCGEIPWCKLPKVKWLCPIPGYDRHFLITEQFGIEMVNIPINEDGPDMDLIEKYIKDEAVKGIWCVPKYSNPSGITYSDCVVRRFAKLKPAAKDFRVYWDNAYAIHDFNEEKKLLNIFEETKKYGNENIIYIFSSTSKITFPGGGIAAIGVSDENLLDIKKHLKYQTICFDKINQLRHARYFKDYQSLKSKVREHCNLLKPKFDVVLSALSTCRIDSVSWSRPNGGYFVCLKTNGIAKEVIKRCKQCGVKLTEAGATHPYHIDESNSYIRLAPSYLSISDLEIAMKILVNAIEIESLLNAKIE